MPPLLTRIAASLFIVSMSVGTCATDAAEIVIQRQAAVTADVVTLGDVATITADPLMTDTLSRVILGPSPARSSMISLGLIQDRLRASHLLGADVTLAGATRCQVVRRVEHQPIERVTYVSQNDVRQAQTRLAEAVAARLETAFPEDGPFQVEVALNDTSARVVNETTGPFQFRGGTADLSQPQALELVGETPVRFLATVRPVTRVAVATVPLSRGMIVQASHIRLEPRDDTNGVKDLSLVVGREVKRHLQPGRAIQPSDLKTVTLVRSNEIVTVSVSVPGLTVRRQMKSRKSGGLGEMITCVSLDGKQTLVAKVTGANTAEVPLDNNPAVVTPAVSPAVQFVPEPPSQPITPSPTDAFQLTGGSR